MKQARLVLRPWSLTFLSVIWLVACQQSGPLQGTVKPGDKKGETKDDKKEDADAERVTPPNNIVGSYLVCQEQEQVSNMNQNAVINCGVYMEPAHAVIPVASLNQWQLSGSNVLFRSTQPTSASIVELRFQTGDLATLKTAVKAAKLHVRVDSGDVFEGFVSDLMPGDSRLATANTAKTSAFAAVWNEGFESNRITSDTYLFHDPLTTAFTTSVKYVNDTVQHPACGYPILEVMRFATQGGSSDSIGAAEGTQFIDTDSACWPSSVSSPIRGASNLTIGKDLTLTPGRAYRVSFKVRQQPLPPGFSPVVQGLQLKINQTVVKDVRTFTDSWQEISFDWIAGPGVSKIEWSDVGAADDSIGILLDDLRVQVENF